MAVLTDKHPWTTNTTGLLLTIDVYEDGERLKSVGLTGRDINVLRVFFAQSMRSDHISPSIRETHLVLIHAVHQMAEAEGWQDALDGKDRRTFSDPLWRDGYNDGYDNFLQTKGATA